MHERAHRGVRDLELRQYALQPRSYSLKYVPFITDNAHGVLRPCNRTTVLKGQW